MDIGFILIFAGTLCKLVMAEVMVWLYSLHEKENVMLSFLLLLLRLITWMSKKKAKATTFSMKEETTALTIKETEQ